MATTTFPIYGAQVPRSTEVPLSPESKGASFAPKPIGQLRWLWTATRRADHIWYQLQNPHIAAVQQFVNHAFEHNEQMQFVATLVVVAERSLKAVECMQHLECTLAHMRSAWAMPASEFPHPYGEGKTLASLREKMRRLARLCCLLAKESFQLAMTLLDTREAFAWDENRRRERVGHFIVDITRLCKNTEYARVLLRGESNRLDRCLKRMGSPFRAQQFLHLLDTLGQLGSGL